MSALLSLPALARLRLEIDHMRLLIQQHAKPVVQLHCVSGRHVAAGDVVPATPSHEYAGAIPFQFHQLAEQGRSAIQARVQRSNRHAEAPSTTGESSVEGTFRQGGER